MAQENVIKTRFQLKHDIQSHWEQAINFVPKIGEPIVYDADENNNKPRVKIGDGQKTVNELPFIEAETSVIPSFSFADEGKFLRIANGAPAWVTVPNAEEASF